MATVSADNASIEVLSLNEIERRFPSEWVLLEETSAFDSNREVRGRVVFHHPNRDEVYRKASEIPLQHGAILFLGERPTIEAAVNL